MIQRTWEEQKSIKDVMIFLQSHGVSTTYAVKIYKQYGEEAVPKATASLVATVTNNPYQLAIDIFGIGFLTADKIARNIGVSPWSKFRYRAGVLHVLDKASEDGHCYLPESKIVPMSRELLTIKGVKESSVEHQENEMSTEIGEKIEHEADEEAIATILSEMVKLEELIREQDDDEPIYYKPSFFYSEQHLAKLLQQKLKTSLDVDVERVKSWINRYTASRKIQLSPQQYVAVAKAASEKLMILTL
ncbi:MAG: helix-hairpin-helix domain-containing protein [Xenococcaceae cyanobacterium MO_207.B15]|nr:helix-hairpin-helix domain-containing protein [Xenococcaceae cyanobacterium MO_207.B15]